MSKGGAIRWSEDQLSEFVRRTTPVDPSKIRAAPGPDLLDIQIEGLKKEANARAAQQGPGEAFYALGRIAKGRMNKTEQAYAQLLEAQKHDGKIIDWKFHVLRVRLADNTFYEPDFLVMTAGRELQIHETKGSFTTQAGQTKIKLCAEVLPWFRVFKASKQKDGSFIMQEFS